MKEVEVKILEVDRPRIENKLIAIGAKKIFDGEINAILLDFNNKSISRQKNILRLRKEGEKSFLTLKKYRHMKKAKACDEYEIKTSDFETTRKILELLGLKKIGKIVKQRKSYILNNAKFEFDKYKKDYNFVPEFLEIEAKDLKTVFKYVKVLGFNEKDCKPWSTKEVVEHYQKKRLRKKNSKKKTKK